MSKPRAHHYCPEAYLAGFTETGTKDGILWAFDRFKKEVRKSKPRNEANQKDFYKLDVKEGADPFSAEKEFGRIESVAIKAIRHIHETLSFPLKEDLEYLVAFVGLLSVRTPGFRKQISEFNAELAKTYVGTALATEEKFKAAINRLKAEGQEVSGKVTFEDMQDFLKRGEYEVVTDKTELVLRALKSASTITDLLLKRDWCIVVADEGCDFVCSDNPVGIVWGDSKLNGRLSPGFGVSGTEVTVPLSKKIGLIGILETFSYRVAKLDKLGVASFNNCSVMRSKRYVNPKKNPHQMGH